MYPLDQDGDYYDLWGIWGLWWRWQFFTASSQLWEFSFLSAVCRRHPLHKDLIEIGNIFFESTKQSSIIKWVANDSGVLLNIFNDLCVCVSVHHVPHRVCFKVPLVQVQVHLGYRLGGLGLGLGGLERSQWVGTSCNFSSSPPRQVQVHLGCASVNLALTRGTWAKSAKFRSPHGRTYTKIIMTNSDFKGQWPWHICSVYLWRQLELKT